MNKLTTIKAPCDDCREGVIKITGKVVFLLVGGNKHKFLIHKHHAVVNDEMFLSDYASGRKFGSLTPVKLKYAKSYKKLTDRSAAEQLILEKIKMYGLQRVLVVLNSAAKIN